MTNAVTPSRKAERSPRRGGDKVPLGDRPFVTRRGRLPDPRPETAGLRLPAHPAADRTTAPDRPRASLSAEQPRTPGPGAVLAARSTLGSAVRLSVPAEPTGGDSAAPAAPGLAAGRERASPPTWGGELRADWLASEGGRASGVPRLGSLFGCCRHIMATRGAEAARGGGSSGGSSAAAGRSRRRSRSGEEGAATAPSGSPEVKAARRRAREEGGPPPRRLVAPRSPPAPSPCGLRAPQPAGPGARRRGRPRPPAPLSGACIGRAGLRSASPATGRVPAAAVARSEHASAPPPPRSRARLAGARGGAPSPAHTTPPPPAPRPVSRGARAVPASRARRAPGGGGTWWGRAAGGGGGAWCLRAGRGPAPASGGLGGLCRPLRRGPAGRPPVLLARRRRAVPVLLPALGARRCEARPAGGEAVPASLPAERWGRGGSLSLPSEIGKNGLSCLLLSSTETAGKEPVRWCPR